MSKYEYKFYAYLMMRASGERLISGLVDNGFSIEPSLTGNKPYYTGDVCTLMCVKLTHAEKSEDKVHDIIVGIIKDKEIPIYGFSLIFGNGGAKFYCGFMPTKKLKSVDMGPYRTSGDVIPFPKKDDGIIDE